MLVDTHAHIYDETYKNIDEIINNATDNGIYKIINCAESLKTSKEIMLLKAKHENILFCSFGIHPAYANEIDEEKLKELEDLIKKNKPVAVGEIGLDYHYENVDREKQKEIFIKQLGFAEKYKLPVIIHSRDATEDTINILKKYKLKGIIHCFTGSVETAKEYIKLGYVLGIGGVVTFKNSKLIETVKQIGIENIVLETDCPYISPEPFRGQKNEPKNIKIIAEYIVKNLNINLKDLEVITNENISRIFDIQ